MSQNDVLDGRSDMETFETLNHFRLSGPDWPDDSMGGLDKIAVALLGRRLNALYDAPPGDLPDEFQTALTEVSRKVDQRR